MIALLQKFIEQRDPENIFGLQNELTQGLTFHLFWKDTKGKYLGCNDDMARNAGLSQASEAPGLTDFDLSWSEGASEYRQNDAIVMHTQRTLIFDEIGILANGTKGRYMSCKAPLFSKQNKVIGSAGIAVLIPGCNKADTKTIIYPGKEYFISNSIATFTNREAECINLSLQGLTAKGIASVLKISPRTVEQHLENVKKKMRCNNKLELIAKMQNLIY